MDEHLIIGLAFVISFAILLKPAVGFFRSMLGAYRKKISDDIQAMFDRQEKSYSLMMLYLEKNKNLNFEIEKIISDAKEKSEWMRDQFVKDVDQILNHKIDYIMTVLSSNVQMAIEEMEDNSVKIAEKALKLFVKNNYLDDKDKQGQMCTNALKELLEKKMH